MIFDDYRDVRYWMSEHPIFGMLYSTNYIMVVRNNKKFFYIFPGHESISVFGIIFMIISVLFNIFISLNKIDYLVDDLCILYFILCIAIFSYAVSYKIIFKEILSIRKTLYTPIMMWTITIIITMSASISFVAAYYSSYIDFKNAYGAEKNEVVVYKAFQMFRNEHVMTSKDIEEQARNLLNEKTGSFKK